MQRRELWRSELRERERECAWRKARYQKQLWQQKMNRMPKKALLSLILSASWTLAQLLSTLWVRSFFSFLFFAFFLDLLFLFCLFPVNINSLYNTNETNPHVSRFISHLKPRFIYHSLLLYSFVVDFHFTRQLCSETRWDTSTVLIVFISLGWRIFWLLSLFYHSTMCFGFSDEAKKRLRSVGYEQVLEREDWNLEVGKRYFFTRNHSTIVAFAIGKKYDFFFLYFAVTLYLSSCLYA